MKTNCWLILGTMLATTAVAQVNTNKLPEIPPPAIPTAPAPAPVAAPAQTQTNAPAKKVTHARKKAKKKAVKAAAKKAPEMPMAPVTLVPGPATVAGEHVNLRGQAGLKGEVVGHAQKGDSVTVISEITLDKPKAGEPAQWAKIALPTGTKVWVDSKYIDTTNNVVAAKKLNLRGGPGENYSVLGVIEKGTSISAVTTKSGWTQIEPPTNAFAYVAASYLKQEASTMDTVATTAPTTTTVANATPENVPPPPPTIPPTTATVPEAQPIAPPATTPPTTPDTTAPVPPPTTTESVPPPAPTPTSETPAILPQPTLAPDDTNLPPPPPRIVTHEGSVRHSVSPVAPTDYELFDPSNDKAINYLYTTTTNLNLGRYNGLHITVTGEEGLDVRWKDTPVLTIQKIYVLSDDKPKAKHWWSK